MYLYKNLIKILANINRICYHIFVRKLKVRINFNNAEVVELADASDSKSDIGDNVRVQVPPSAPSKVPKFKRFRDFLLLKCFL